MARLAFDALTLRAALQKLGVTRVTCLDRPRRPALSLGGVPLCNSARSFEVELPNLGLVSALTFSRSTSLQIDLFFSRMTKVKESDEFPFNLI